MTSVYLRIEHDGHQMTVEMDVPSRDLLQRDSAGRICLNTGHEETLKALRGAVGIAATDAITWTHTHIFAVKR